MNPFLLAGTAAATILAVGILAPRVMGAGTTVPTSLRDAAGCLRSTPVTQTHAVFIDFTDRPSVEHLTHLEALKGTLLRETPLNAKILVGALTPDTPPGPVTLLLEACNPGTRNGPFTERPSPAPIDQYWRARFAQPLAESLDRAKALPASREASPILEGITALTSRADFDGRVSSRRLTVVTDGLQLTPGVYSHFRGGDLWKAYQASALPAAAQADLTGVRVEIVYLRRPEFAQRQTDQHRAFLVRWLESRGAAAVTFRGAPSPVLKRP